MACLALLALGGLLACGEAAEAAPLEPEAPEAQSEPLRHDPDSIEGLDVEQLLEHITVAGIQRYFDATGGYEVHWEATGALGRRPQELDRLLEAFEAPVDDVQAERVALALHAIGTDLEPGGPREAQLLRAFEEFLDPEPVPGSRPDTRQYYSILYRAERGDREALRILNDTYGKWPVPSFYAADAVALFGKFHYEPAIPNLVKTLEAASLNLGGAACGSLMQLMPGPHPELRSPSEAARYFEALLAEREQERADEPR